MDGRHSYIIATSWNPSPVSEQFRALAHGLADRGHRVALIVDGQRRDVVDPAGNPAVYSWPSRRPTRFQDLAFLSDLLRDRRPHCLVSNFGAVNTMMVVGWMARTPVRVAWYRTLQSQLDLDLDPSLHLQTLRFRKRLVYRLCTHLVANSWATRADAVATQRVPREKVVVWPNALLDPQLPRGYERLEGRLVCVGRIARSKGQDVVVRAVARLVDQVPNLKVRFLGEGPERSACERLARELGVSDRCRFTGRLPHDRVLQEMATAQAVLVPSRSEAFGIVNIEAFSVGTPVVASGVGGIVDIVRHRKEGLLVPPDDPAALAAAIRTLLQDPRLVDALGAGARRRFESSFEQTMIVERQLDWLESIVGRGGSQPDERRELA